MNAAQLAQIKTAERDIRQAVVENLAQGAHGAGMTKWGLANGFTFAAHAVPELSYDEATDLERAGAKVVTMAERSWGFINRKIERHEEKATERGALVHA